MPGYRFCRPDDIPLLVDAVNSCYRVHFPESEVASVDNFREAARELGFWASSSMIAFEGKQIVGVLIGCKRQDRTLISHFGMLPDYQGLGHGTHLLNSLSGKLAVLGPPTIVAEIPTTLGRTCTLFERLGYARTAEYASFVLERILPELKESAALVELDEPQQILDGLTDPAEVAWERTAETLAGRFKNKQKGLRTIAVVSGSRIEAALVFYERAGFASIERFLGDSTHSAPISSLLIRMVSSKTRLPIRINRLCAQELAPEILRELEFRELEKSARFSRTAEAL